MTKNDKNEMVLKILEDLAKSSNDIALIEDNIRKLMKGESPIKSLIYYLDKCNPIMLLKIKSNLENYKEITKFKRDVFLPNAALFISVIFSVLAIGLNIVETKNTVFYIFLLIEILLVIGLVYLANKFTDIKRITKFENYIKVVLYLINFMLENKKYDLNKYSEKLYIKKHQ